MRLHRWSWFAFPLLAVSLSAQWHRSPDNGHLYALTAKLDWHQAEAAAVAAGGHLATVRSQAEQDWLVATFGGSTYKDAKWIGLNDEAVEGQWVWTSGEAVTFTCWDTAQPDDHMGMEDAVTHVWHTPWWNDFPVTELLPGIIEVISDQASSYTPFGSGCAGSVGVPVLAAAPGSRPLIGDTLTLQLSNLPIGLFAGNAFVIFGFSRTEWAGITLPMDLAPFGIPSCTGYVSVDLAVPVATLGGVAECSFEVPIDAGLLGLHFFNQGLVQDPGVNPSGAVVTNAAEGVIGVR